MTPMFYIKFLIKVVIVRMLTKKIEEVEKEIAKRKSLEQVIGRSHYDCKKKLKKEHKKDIFKLYRELGDVDPDDIAHYEFLLKKFIDLDVKSKYNHRDSLQMAAATIGSGGIGTGAGAIVGAVGSKIATTLGYTFAVGGLAITAGVGAIVGGAVLTVGMGSIAIGCMFLDSKHSSCREYKISNLEESIETIKELNYISRKMLQEVKDIEFLDDDSYLGTKDEAMRRIIETHGTDYLKKEMDRAKRVVKEVVTYTGAILEKTKIAKIPIEADFKPYPYRVRELLYRADEKMLEIPISNTEQVELPEYELS
jgi:hypothetical protein